MILFFALCFIGVAIAGISAFVIFWPLALVHLRDRHPQVGERLPSPAFIHPGALLWLARGEYRQVQDRGFTGLATPARVALFTLLFGLLMSAGLWIIGTALQ